MWEALNFSFFFFESAIKFPYASESVQVLFIFFHFFFLSKLERLKKRNSLCAYFPYEYAQRNSQTKPVKYIGLIRRFCCWRWLWPWPLDATEHIYVPQVESNSIRPNVFSVVVSHALRCMALKLNIFVEKTKKKKKIVAMHAFLNTGN